VTEPESPQGLRVIIGAGDQRWDGRIATHRDQIDLTDSATWDDG
jgi:predicted SAM-dependent methyltransferase